MPLCRAWNPRALGLMCWLLCSCCSHEPWLLLLHQHTLSEGQTVGRSQMATRIFGSVWMWDSSCHFIRSLFGLVASFHPMHVGQGMKRRGECGVKAATRGPASSLYSYSFSFSSFFVMAAQCLQADSLVGFMVSVLWHTHDCTLIPWIIALRT